MKPGYSPFSIRRIYYRGKLDSCNYTCSYCPFWRKSPSPASEDGDRQAWERFITAVEQWKGKPLQLFIIPYGEALIHWYYREGVARLAAFPHVEGVCCQTNLSFPAERWLDELRLSSASIAKIKVWASFHPEMTTVDRFVRQLHSLRQAGMEVCAGAVGNPYAKSVLLDLRNALSPDIYMFINAMQGLKAPLSEQDRDFFIGLDNLFEYDRKNAPAQWNTCLGGRSNCFVDWKGDVYVCPRSRVKMGNLYQNSEWQLPLSCKRKVCDCYIAFSNLDNHPLHRIMGNGAFWRIPDKPLVQSVFFDIDGTLTDAQSRVPESYSRSLQYMAQSASLYLATSLSVEQARRRLGKTLFRLFKGGVFAGGGLISYEGRVECLSLDSLPDICKEAAKTTAYSYQGKVYKYSLLVPLRSKRDKILAQLKEKPCRFSQKGPLITVTHAEASKREGVLRLFNALGLSAGQTLIVGNSMDDWPMMSLVPYACAVTSADSLLKERVPYVLNPDRLPAFFQFDVSENVTSSVTEKGRM